MKSIASCRLESPFVSSTDFPAVMIILSGAGCSKYGTMRTLCAALQT